jgi:nitrite reductase (NO-forming)
MRRALTLLAVGAFGLAGCGDDSGGGSGKTVTVPAGKPVQVEASEFQFSPSHIVVKGGGGAVEIDLKNAGSSGHDLRVEQDGKDLGGTPVFAGGGTRTATVNLKPGSYEFICSVPGHEAQGMKGTLEVK